VLYDEVPESDPDVEYYGLDVLAADHETHWCSREQRRCTIADCNYCEEMDE